MKLNNEIIYLTGKTYVPGKYLNEISVTDVYDHKQSTIYYKSGNKKIDNIFGENGYIKQGYVTSMVADENGMRILFVKFFRNDVVEIANVCIDRDSITKLEMIPYDGLEFVKNEDAKHKAKYMLKNGTGIIGGLVGLAGEKYGLSANTYLGNGFLFKLFYLNEENSEEYIEMYCSEENKVEILYFLGIYYKNSLNEADKETIDTDTDSSGCSWISYLIFVLIILFTLYFCN